MSTVHTRRIMGVETEFGITAIRNGHAALSPEEVARYLFRPIVAEYSSSNIFTPSAARLYLDVGSHPEYATAECDSLTQLLNHDKAGEKIFHQLALQAEQALADDNIGGQVYLFKNNVDSKGNSYGAHENYLISREMVLKSFGKQLLPFMITRQLIAGAGLIKDGRFVLSQRADQVWEGVSSATTRTRPIINTRDEPHGDSHRFRRMHVIVGDSNMAEPTFALKVGSTLLVIEMLEAGFDLENFELENPILHIREIADDATGATPLDLVGGGTVTALEVQKSILASAKKWLEVRPDEGTPNEEIGRVIDLWERTLTAIETQDFSSVDKEIDWVIKRILLDKYRDKLGLSAEAGYDHPKLKQIDLTYHDIHPERSLFYLLQRKGAVKRWTTDEAIAHAVDTAPETTRATLRGQFLAAARKYNAKTSIDWVHLKVERPEPKVVEMLDPFVTEDERVDELIGYMRASAES
ncbi:Pup--protein ligase [Corynebacterium lubricantis]|uniref:Pup--protein ligase n=1 Tax=Corynebacterium lubricantis TaxID=541095 RepID=UPI0003705105|nr:Pup--protein ligase [Corynebacterium lubricantis]